MAALQTTVRVLKDEFLNQDMYMSFMQQSGTIGRIRALVLQARGLGPDPGLDAALRSFLLLAKSMEELFMRREKRVLRGGDGAGLSKGCPRGQEEGA